MRQVGNRRGQTVLLAYVTVIVLTVLGGSLLNSSLAAHRQSQLQKSHLDVFYLAEGGLEDAIAKFSNGIANFQVDPQTAQYPAVGTITTNFADGSTAISTIAQAEAVQRTIIDPDGLSIFVKNYHITTTAQHPTNNTITATLHQIVARRLIYTFQHAVFYDKDLEWLPGPDMTLSGRVHSNHDIYLGANTVLTVDSEYLRAAGNIYNKRKDNNTVPVGQVQIKKAASNPVTYPAMAGLDSSSGTWVTESQTRWNGTVKSGVHGVAEQSVPVVGSTNPGGFYDTNADVKIVNGTVTQGGVTLVEGVDIPLGTVQTVTTFYNNREGKTVKMTNLDMAKLAGGSYDSKTYTNHLPSNGLLYTTRSDASASQEPGIRLINGAEIKRTGGVTIASNDPVYVQGDYNTISKKPVAVIADAMNLLSGNWNDANSTKNDLNSRVATSTTFNAAFIAGINTTTSGNYNGGLENYPRMHEKWTGQTLAITGSFVSLWNSQIATGDWKYGQQGSNSQYAAPIRNWNYDTSFSSGTSMPPFTPWVVEIRKGAWWKQ